MLFSASMSDATAEGQAANGLVVVWILKNKGISGRTHVLNAPLFRENIVDVIRMTRSGLGSHRVVTLGVRMEE
jgi:hypothetical protein